MTQVSVVSFGKDTGPHNLVLSSDDSRLVVSDYFLNQDAAGIIHFEGDHKIHVIKVTHNTLSEDTRFNLDFNTAFPTGPARPNGIAMKKHGPLFARRSSVLQVDTVELWYPRVVDRSALPQARDRDTTSMLLRVARKPDQAGLHLVALGTELEMARARAFRTRSGS